MSSVADDVKLALQLADEADVLTMERFGALDLRIETKPDLTPVTDADKGAEEALRATLTAHRPSDALLGEEFGGTAVFIGAPDEADVSRRVAEGVSGPVFDLTGQTTLPQLAAVLAENLLDGCLVRFRRRSGKG